MKLTNEEKETLERISEKNWKYYKKFKGYDIGIKNLFLSLNDTLNLIDKLEDMYIDLDIKIQKTF